MEEEVQQHQNDGRHTHDPCKKIFTHDRAPRVVDVTMVPELHDGVRTVLHKDGRRHVIRR
jgi:hypothetical protein